MADLIKVIEMCRKRVQKFQEEPLRIIGDGREFGNEYQAETLPEPSEITTSGFFSFKFSYILIVIQNS